MAVNKNFVVKNGLEVNENLILANADDKRVGIGSTTPTQTLDVKGGIGATDLIVTGFTTLTQDLQVGTSGSIFYVDDTNQMVGVGTSAPAYLLDVRSSVSTGQTALYVYGDMRLTGDLNLDDITIDDINATDLYVSGLSTFIGVSTHSGQAFFNDVQVSGAGTVTGDLTVDGNLNVAGDITYDEISGRNLYISGLATIGTLGVQTSLTVSGTGATTTTLNVTGVSTFAGFTTFSDNVYITGYSTVTQDLSVGGNLNVTGDITYDEVSCRNIIISGLSTFEGLSYFGSNVGVGTTNPAIAADSNNTNILNAGIVTANYIYGDISGATGVTTAITAAIGVSSEGTFVGSAATIINFASSNGTAWDIQNSGAGIATASITPGVSIGLAIALGG